ncbi:MAG: metalloregulator ArsR/SmtB family transcription factor [Cyclobacteriaceae bacterium]
MGITKTEGFKDQVTHMADLLKVMGNPARLSILEFLVESPSCICNDLVDELPLAQPTISRHLSELKRVGFIKGNVQGKNICYCLDREVLKEVNDFVTELSGRLEKINSYC